MLHLSRIMAVFAIVYVAAPCAAQQLLKTDGYGSLSGKVTLEGKFPILVDLTKRMMDNPDKACCLDPKGDPKQKAVIEQMWIVDAKSRAVSNVMVWVTPPKGTFFPTHKDYLVRKEKVVIDQPYCAFLPRVSAYNPVRYDETTGKLIPTGQELILRNSAVVPHNIRATGQAKYNQGFNRNLPPKTDLNATKELNAQQKLNPQHLPVTLECNFHNWMTARLFVFDHPYYAMTKEDGTYEIPFVPAGAKISLFAYHEDAGWVTQGQKNGEDIVIQAGKNTKNFTVEVPRMP